jgi:hypothetical protein
MGICWGTQGFHHWAPQTDFREQGCVGGQEQNIIELFCLLYVPGNILISLLNIKPILQDALIVTEWTIIIATAHHFVIKGIKELVAKTSVKMRTYWLPVEGKSISERNRRNSKAKTCFWQSLLVIQKTPQVVPEPISASPAAFQQPFERTQAEGKVHRASSLNKTYFVQPALRAMQNIS